MGHLTPPDTGWRKSSWSSPNGGDCVEIATADATIWLRDSKDPAGPALHVTPAAFHAFLRYAVSTTTSG